VKSRPLFYSLLELLDHRRTVSLSSIPCSTVSPSSRARSSGRADGYIVPLEGYGYLIPSRINVR
jgi:hypothetical protein